MSTNAQTKAKQRYMRKLTEEGRMNQLNIRFFPPDQELWEHLQAHKPMATYIKDLIRKDMSNDQNQD